VKTKILRLNFYIGLLVMIASNILVLSDIPFMKTWFYCFVWWSFILIVDSINFRKSSHSPLYDSPKDFIFSAFISVFIWLIFELFNLRLKNWSYHELPPHFWERWLGFFISFASVIPAIKEISFFFENLFKERRSLPFSIRITKSLLNILIILGVFSVFLSLCWPRIFFPLAWLCLILLLDPFNYRLGNKSLLRELEAKKWIKPLCWLLAGFSAGILWEFWNFLAGAHWRYSLPYLNFGKIFQMPLFGYTGFLPFALEVFALYHLLSWVYKKLEGKILLKSIACIFLFFFYAGCFYLIDTVTLFR